MKTKSTKLIITCLAIVCLSLVPISAFAANCSANVCRGSYPDAVKSACGCSGVTGTNSLPTTIKNILTTIIEVAGVVAVVFVIVGGVNYMTSGGDPGKIEKAKKTILYSIIGLAVCALSFVIVNFVIVNMLR